MNILLADLKIAEIEAKYVRCDNSGENKVFYNYCHLNGELINNSSLDQGLHKEMAKLTGNFRLSTVKSAQC
jgi:hypothetical protein